LGVLQSGRIEKSQPADRARRLLAELCGAIGTGAPADVKAFAWTAVREMPDTVARERGDLRIQRGGG
jgi:hypothetical protein